jgi:hypothetical protein
VLVAKAVSHDGTDLDLVLYNGGEAGIQDITIERLKAGGSYMTKNDGVKFTADKDGKAVLKVSLDGRTPVHIVHI